MDRNRGAYEFGDFRLEPESRRLLRAGEAVPITVKAFETLAALVQDAGRTIDKDELLRRVWPDTIVEEANLSQQIFILRKMLGEGPKEHRYIATVPRRGYCFVAPVIRIAPDHAGDAAANGAPAVAGTPLRLTLMLPADTPLALGPCSPLALSPDGRTLAHVGHDAGGPSLFVRRLAALESTRLARTEGAMSPFFSPDGRWIGYFARGLLWKILVNGGTPIALCKTGSECRGASWTDRDEIVFAPTPASGLSLVDADGGTPRAVTTLDFAQGERTHRWPDALPGGRAALFTLAGAASTSFDDADIAVVSFETGEYRIVQRHGSSGRYVPTGHLVYLRGGSIMAVPFDAERFEAKRPIVPVVERVMPQPTGAGQFTFSHAGCLMFLTGETHDVGRRIVWVSEAGDSELLPFGELAIEEPRLSPDLRRLAAGIRATTSDIWVSDLERGVLTRLTFDGDNFAPIWTRDGTRLTFSSNRNGPCQIYWQALDENAPAALLGGPLDLVPGSWSPDGDLLLFTEYHPETGADIWIWSLSAKQPPRAVVRTEANEFSPTFAPDGRSFAFASDESGRLEVYVMPFPGPGRRVRASVEGGAEPVWSRDGRRLYYRKGASVMAVDFDGDRARAGAPRQVAEGPYLQGAMTGLPNYDVAADGRLLLIAQAAAEVRPHEVSVIVNWFADLASRTAQG